MKLSSAIYQILKKTHSMKTNSTTTVFISSIYSYNAENMQFNNTLEHFENDTHTHKQTHTHTH